MADVRDFIARAFIEAIDESIKRNIAEADAVRAEIKQKGTYWAGDEIWSLRRTVMALRERLEKSEGERP